MWPADRDGVIAEQRRLAVASPPECQPASRDVAIGACAVCFARGQTGAGARGDRAWAAAAVIRGRRVVCDATIDGQAGARYEPGLLGLREGPILEAAVRTLPFPPDVLLVDATGRDRPRRAGMALQLGAVLGLPTVRVARRPLLASGDWPDDRRGATAPLLLDGERVGAWLRTRARPLGSASSPPRTRAPPGRRTSASRASVAHCRSRSKYVYARLRQITRSNEPAGGDLRMSWRANIRACL
jgi:deoxyribonuclease V